MHQIRSWCDFAPTWQNDVPSILRASEPYQILGDHKGGMVVFPSNGDVPMLAVRRDVRRQGIGRALLDAPARPLRIMNVDDRDRGIATFLENCGAQRFVRQIEMVRSL